MKKEPPSYSAREALFLLSAGAAVGDITATHALEWWRKSNAFLAVAAVATAFAFTHDGHDFISPDHPIGIAIQILQLSLDHTG